MTWSEILDRVAERAGLPRAAARKVIDALLDVVAEELGAGQAVHVPGLGTFDAHWAPERALRSIATGRKQAVDGRWVPRFRAAEAVKRVVRERTPQLLRDPEHQKAWRLAETLVADVVLYHTDRRPLVPTGDVSAADLDAACVATFGAAWTRARARFEREVPEGVRAARDYLTGAALRRWAPISIAG